MMAFFSVFTSLLLGVVIWKGSVIRNLSLRRAYTEDGEKVLGSEGLCECSNTG